MVIKNPKSEIRNPKLRLRTGDTVRVLVGKDRGKTGKIVAVFPKTQRVIVEGVSLVKKHVRPRRAGEKGQRVTIASPLALSNVQVVCPQCKRGARIGVRFENGERVRVCKNCSAVITF